MEVFENQLKTQHGMEVMKEQESQSPLCPPQCPSLYPFAWPCLHTDSMILSPVTGMFMNTCMRLRERGVRNNVIYAMFAKWQTHLLKQDCFNNGLSYFLWPSTRYFIPGVPQQPTGVCWMPHIGSKFAIKGAAANWQVARVKCFVWLDWCYSFLRSCLHV